MASGNFHGEEVREIVQTLSQEWKQLSSASAKKGNVDMDSLSFF